MNKMPSRKPGDEPVQIGPKRLRMPSETSCPPLPTVKAMLEEAQNRRGTLVEMPWINNEQKNFILTCQWDETLKDPVWTLYEDTEGSSKVVWTQPFAPGDMEFMYDILSMSAGKTSKLEIPEELRPRTADDYASEVVEPTFGGGPALGAGLAGGLGGGLGGGLSGGLGGGLSGGLGGGLSGGITPPAQASSNSGQVPQVNPPGFPQNPLYAQQQQFQSGANIPTVPMPQMQQMPPMPQPPYPYPPQMQPMPPMPQGQPPYPYPNAQQMPPMPPGQPPQGYPQQYGQAPMGYPYQQPQSGYGQEPEPKIPLDYHLIDKRCNVLLGTLLKEAGLISEPTLEAALKLQEMVRDEKMTVEKAPEVLKRLHAMGSSIDQYLTKGDLEKNPLQYKPSQEAPKPPASSQSQQAAGAAGAISSGGKDLRGAFDLLQKAQLLTESDITTATNVRKKHGGDLIQILEAAGKVHSKTVDAALLSLPLIREGLMKIEQVIMALNYCERMRVSFDDALDEMGWQNPRKLRTDLPL